MNTTRTARKFEATGTITNRLYGGGTHPLAIPLDNGDKVMWDTATQVPANLRKGKEITFTARAIESRMNVDETFTITATHLKVAK